ncbi:hypothetical protein Tco_0317455 [Tanacetum coccineum]
MVERDDEIKAFKKFKWKVVRDHEVKVLGEVNVELESASKKLREKLSQEEDTKEEAFEDMSGKSCEHFGWDWPENDSPDTKVVVSQNNVHEEVAEEVIKMANDQAKALSYDQEVTGECLDDEHVEERRPSKRIRVTQKEMVNNEKPKKG